MIELSYDQYTKKWYQKSAFQYLYWGKEQIRLSPPLNPSPLSVLKVESNKDVIRPLVGILAGSNPIHHFSGNAAIFKAIQNEIITSGGLSFVFTADDIRQSYIDGYLFDQETNKWTGYRFPYPNIVYNRIPDRQEEQTKKIAVLFQRLSQQGIPYFNRSFFQKLDIISQLSTHHRLTMNVPPTDELSSFSLEEYLKRYESVFCKPSSGSKGRGIFKIKNTGTGYRFIDHETILHFTSHEKLTEHITPMLYEKYIIQQEIKRDTYQGYPYDFRILIQKPFDAWQVTGIGIRAAQRDSLTTHVPRGGRIIPYHKVANYKDTETLTLLAISTAELLEQQTMMAECSLDIGKDMDGHFWIFEANSKPMRFDEPSIYHASIRSLISTFRTFSAF
ncbi:MAG: YheC/YheD family protein [Anaerobacillus sp.]